jgi:hypothetical protein
VVPIQWVGGQRAGNAKHVTWNRQSTAGRSVCRAASRFMMPGALRGPQSVPSDIHCRPAAWGRTGPNAGGGSGRLDDVGRWHQIGAKGQRKHTHQGTSGRENTEPPVGPTPQDSFQLATLPRSCALDPEYMIPTISPSLAPGATCCPGPGSTPKNTTYPNFWSPPSSFTLGSTLPPVLPPVLPPLLPDFLLLP